MQKPSYRHIEELRDRYAACREDIRKRLQEFSAVEQEEYFYELIYCLLTPQSNAANAAQAVDALKREHVLDNEAAVARLLARKQHYIRFHNTKAKRIGEVRQQCGKILAALRNGARSTELRAWLVANVKGMGWKEASHFLRNIGHRNLAILDRHILKNLKTHGVIRSLPKTLTPKRYLYIEQQFQRFAETIGIPMDELDLLFWSKETGQILK